MKNNFDPMETNYQHYSDMVFRYLLSLSQNPDVAEELTQETFYQAVRCQSKYNGNCKFSTWLCAIAKNIWRGYCAGSQRDKKLLEYLEEKTEETTEDIILQKLDTVHLMTALHKMKDPFREIIYLRIFGNLSFWEIGEILGKSENWARVNFYRAKRNLAEEVIGNE